jgi:biopolymer transport protein ExbD
MISKREARNLIRKAVQRVPEGEEIRHLNIMPMMDMMTILLVAMIFQASTAAALSVSDVDLPASQSQEEFPEGAVTLTIAKEAILVEGSPVVPVKNGSVDSSEKKGGALGIQISKLSRFLGAVRQEFEAEKAAKGEASLEKPAIPELFIIADKTTPYRLLFEVIASARAKEAGYRRFRLIVLEKSTADAASGE